MTASFVIRAVPSMDRVPQTTTAEFGKRINRVVMALPPDRLRSLADYAKYLARKNLREEVTTSEKQLAPRHGVNWHRVRPDK